MIGMAQAKARFSGLIEQVIRSGEAVTISRRDIPVVQIVPYRPDGEAWPRLPFPVKAAELNAAFEPRAVAADVPTAPEAPKPPAIARIEAGRPGLTLAQLTAASRP